MSRALSTTNKGLLAFTLPFAVVLWALVVPEVHRTAVLTSTVDALRQTTTSQGSAKQKETYKAKVTETRTKANLLLPSTDEQYDLSVQVEALARSSGVTLTGLAVSAAAATSTLPKTTPAKDDVVTSSPTPAPKEAAPAAVVPLKVTVNLAITGSYAQVQEVVKGLTRLDRLTQIDQLSVTSGTGGSVSASITAISYYLPATKK
jgi:Tfp pilus assembly protein PilO